MKHIELLQHQLEYALETVEQQYKRIAELETELKRFVTDFGNEYPAETRRAAQIIAKAKGR